MDSDRLHTRPLGIWRFAKVILVAIAVMMAIAILLWLGGSGR